MAAREGHAKWTGGLKDGTGEVTVGAGVYTGPYSFNSRFEDGEGTNPEDLIAAAHAACFSMALSGVLGECGHAPTSIETSARAYLRRIDDKPTIAKIELETRGVVPGIDQAHFEKHAAQAKDGCPVSRALAGVPEVTVSATLVEQ
jgi:osmotically inducible protein OsmC